ncbi:MAG: mechanosensitive ion channel family protein [Solobacterium sp.]|nr:mechanosensitive ion channel family protein [Solobacterium sp.]
MDWNDILTFGSDVFEEGFVPFLVSALVTLIITNLVTKAMDKTEKAVSGIGPGNQKMAYRYLFSTLKTVVRIIAAVLILSRVKMLQALGRTALGATSILAVAVSLAAQESFGNYISGFFLAIYQPFHTGDLIIMSEKGITGTVSEITLRHTVLKTYENTTVIIPNSVMNTAIIEDRSIANTHYANWISVSVAYGTDIPLAKRLIREIAERQPEFVDIRTIQEKNEGKDAVTIRVNDFQDSGIELKFRIQTATYGGFFTAASNIREAIASEFPANGIVIPYPVRTVEIVNGGRQS